MLTTTTYLLHSVTVPDDHTMIIRQHLVVDVGVLIGQAHLRLCLLLADFGGGF